MKFGILFSLISSFLLFSCTKKNQTVSRFSELNPFTEIELNNSFDVYLNEDTIYNIEMIGNEEIIGDIVFDVEDSVLKISNDWSPKWLAPRKNKIQLYINSKQLRKVSANETCNIETISPITSYEFGLILKSKVNQASLELACHIFYYWNNFPCGGKLTLSGNTEILKLWNYAIMSVDAKNLDAKYALVENSSEGNCEITVTDKLEYSIHGDGDIHLYGSPPEIIEIQLTSSGQLILL